MTILSMRGRSFWWFGEAKFRMSFPAEKDKLQIESLSSIFTSRVMIKRSW